MSRLIYLHDLGGEAIKHDVLLPVKLFEIVKWYCGRFRRVHLPVLFELDDNAFHEINSKYSFA